MSDLRDHLRALRAEAGYDFIMALDTLKKILQNILEQPEADKFRTIRLSNTLFHSRVGRFSSGTAMLRFIGFEDAFGAETAPTDSATPTHLALPIADPATLANGLVLVTAAREASDYVENEARGQATAEPQPPPRPQPRRVEAVRSNALGKRKAPVPGDEGGGKRSAIGSGSSDGGGTSGGSSAAIPEDVARDGDDGQVRDTGLVEPPVELSSYTAEAIDSHFLTLCGGPFLEGLSAAAADGPLLARLVATARDARRVTTAIGDTVARQRAEHWVSSLEEHGESLGWCFDDVGEDDDNWAAADASGAVGTSASGDSTDTSALAAGSSTHPSDLATPLESDIIEADGNFDACSICGVGGLLICCEACPQAYHPACLGDQAPPEDAPEDEAWFCPPCAKQLGMA